MCEPNIWWWTVFFTILLCGVFGGTTRYCSEEVDNKENISWFSHVFMGVAAAFIVPLFLNTISSTLILETADPKKQDKFFVLIGFCITAAIFARPFIDSVSKKALELSVTEVKGIAKNARNDAKNARNDAKNADNRAIAMYKPLNLLQENKFSEALAELDVVLVDDPDSSEAWAWKAFCLKRVNRIDDAIEAITKALKLEDKEVCNWLYNLACYKCLAGASVSEVIAVLSRIKASANSDQIARVKKDIENDEDFKIIKDDANFKTFLKSF